GAPGRELDDLAAELVAVLRELLEPIGEPLAQLGGRRIPPDRLEVRAGLLRALIELGAGLPLALDLGVDAADLLAQLDDRGELGPDRGVEAADREDALEQRDRARVPDREHGARRGLLDDLERGLGGVGGELDRD